MIRKTFAFGLPMLAILYISMAAGAQGRLQGRGGNQPNANSADLLTFTGQVASVNMAPGQGFPSFRLTTGGREITIMTGPYRLLASQGFQINPGAQLTVKAFATFVADTYIAAEIRDDATGRVINLLNQAGPGFGRRGGWGMRGGFGMRGGCYGMGAGAANVDPSSLIVLEGTVRTVDMAYGRGFPSFTLNAAGGDATVVACPFRSLQDANFSISVGDRLLVRAFPCLRIGNAYTAVEIQNITTGATIQLR